MNSTAHATDGKRNLSSCISICNWFSIMRFDFAFVDLGSVDVALSKMSNVKAFPMSLQYPSQKKKSRLRQFSSKAFNGVLLSPFKKKQQKRNIMN